MNSDICRIAEATLTAEAQNKYIMKILFGPMFGCELHLPADDYFIIVNPGLALQKADSVATSAAEHTAAYMKNTLYLACDTPSPNLVLYLSSPVKEEDLVGHYRVEIQDEVRNHSELLCENEVFIHNHIHFAIKKLEDKWSESINNFTLSPILDINRGVPKNQQKLNNRKKFPLITGAIFFAALLLITVVIWYKKDDDTRFVSTLSEALSGAPAPVEIVRGHNNNMIYVLTTQYESQEWAKKIIYKLRKNNSVALVSLNQHKKNVISELIKEGFPVLQIDYANAQHPVIILWQNLSPEQTENLISATLRKIPFAINSRTLIKTKPQLLQDARQGLDRLHINYQQISTADGYALVVRDALNDSTLTALDEFIKDFNNQWGSYVINFSINLTENWLQNKSYLSSSDGYVFLKPQHWYFQ